jgi:hypothetical protein
MNPQALCERVGELATSGALSELIETYCRVDGPVLISLLGTPNLLAYN